MSDRTYIGEAQYWREKIEPFLMRIEALDNLPVKPADLTETQKDALKNAVLNEVRELKRQLP